jgi:hypothetical protein
MAVGFTDFVQPSSAEHHSVQVRPARDQLAPGIDRVVMQKRAKHGKAWLQAILRPQILDDLPDLIGSQPVITDIPDVVYLGTFQIFDKLAMLRAHQRQDKARPGAAVAFQCGA